MHNLLLGGPLFINYPQISDFGLSRDLCDESYYISHGGKVPVKWTAPEALNYRKYSTASDVWSYGCLLYEIWALGVKPFSNLNNKEVSCILLSAYFVMTCFFVIYR